MLNHITSIDTTQAGQTKGAKSIDQEFSELLISKLAKILCTEVVPVTLDPPPRLVSLGLFLEAWDFPKLASPH